MKTPEEMIAYFRAMPSKKQEPNPFWEFDENTMCIKAKSNNLSPLYKSEDTLRKVREFFRRYYESFHSESQVLCVTPEDAKKLKNMYVPVLTEGHIAAYEVVVMVLPQDNHMGTSVISEWFWQNRIIGEGIKPVVRIHSHHVFDPYQSITDYSTLNSGTLEMVLGKINNEELNVCYWLDVPGTDTKAQTFVAQEQPKDGFSIRPFKFNGPNADTPKL